MLEDPNAPGAESPEADDPIAVTGRPNPPADDDPDQPVHILPAGEPRLPDPAGASPDDGEVSIMPLVDPVSSQADAGHSGQRLIGSPGADEMTGGPGIDTADYSDALGGVIIRLNHGAGYRNDADGDRFTSVETLVLTAFNDRVTGSEDKNHIDGGAGDDTLNGFDGDDAVEGGTGADTVRGAAGDDQLDGGAGDDLVSGGNGADTVRGGDSRDELFGGNGRDILDGGGGTDTLDGGAGDDRLTGGADADIFRFPRGNDTITDFEDGIDLIDAMPQAYASAATLPYDITQRGDDTVISDGADNSLTLLGVDADSITVVDFVF